jgi:hypothetical protein
LSSRIRAHIRSNVVGYIALFVALSGTAAALPGSNTVTSGDIRPNAVKTGDIKDGAVTNPKLADGAVTSGKIDDEAVGPTQVANGSLAGTDIAGNSLTGTEVDESTLDTGVVQKRIGSSCGGSEAVQAVAADGTVTCGDTGGNVIGVISGGVDQAVANGDFMSPSGGSSSSSAVRNTVMLPVDAHLSNFRASTRDAFLGNSVIVEIFKVPAESATAVATGITCAIPAFVGDGTCLAPLNAVAWNAGDMFTYRMSTAGGALANGMAFAVAVETP